MKRFFLFALVATVFAACSTSTLEMPIPSNEIWYTSSDGNVIEPNATDVFGANITSNTYENGVGVITFEKDVALIGENAFRNCKALTSITIPDSVTTIGVRAFAYCDALTSITIPDGVTEIGDYAFTSCDALTSVTIGDSVTTIGDSAFGGCGALTSVTIPDSVTTIGRSAFYSCDALKAFYGKFASTDNRCLIVNGVLNSFAPAGLTTYSIPDSVTTIGNNAFRDCDALTSVTIGDSVTTIGNYAFYYCSALTSVTIPDSVTTIGDYAFTWCNALKAFYGKFASADNRCLIVNGVLNSFAPAGLTTYSIPNSVTTIGKSAFAYCRALTSVTIPDSVTTIGDSAFAYYRALKEVYCKSTTPPSLGRYAFDYNASGRKIYVPTASVDAYKTADGWKEYADAIVAMPIPSNQIWYTSSDCNIIEPNATDVFGANITSNTYENGVGVITFDGDVTTIGNWAFYDCGALTSVTIPDSVTTIGDYAFAYCDALTSVTIPNSETMIGIYAFRNCDALTSVTIPDSVTAIGEYAFRGCNALKEVYCHSTTPPIAIRIDPKWSAFNGNASGRKIYVPTASVDAYKAADGWREYADAIEPYNFTE